MAVQKAAPKGLLNMIKEGKMPGFGEGGFKGGFDRDRWISILAKEMADDARTADLKLEDMSLFSIAISLRNINQCLNKLLKKLG
jgi:hypothetical protein